MSKLKDYRKLFAWISIYLIISITFFTANTLAYNYRVSGEDLVNGWRKPDDITIFYVNASANVSIQLDNGNWQQMICEQHSGTNSNTYYTCEYFLDRNTLGPTISNVTRKLRQETATPIEYTTTIKVDRLPPKIEKLNITKIGSALKVSYSIKDYSYSGKTGCSGLDYITYAVGPEADTIEFNTTVCEYDGIVIFNESEFYQEDFPISLTAYDRLGQSVTNTTIMTVDFMGPDIQDDWQIEKNGNVIDILSKSPENMQYDVVVFIDEPKLDINKVRGDLSGLHTNPVLKNTLKNKQATCLKESENLYKCKFSSIPIRPASANLQIIVNAYDASGNYANKTLTKTATLIDDPGQITYVGPLKEHCTSSLSKCYTATESQMFIAEISPGSNFSALIFGFNTETKVGPCFFQEQENKWQCFYRYNVPNVAQLKVYIPETSRDIYGNKVTYTERSVIVDSVPPKILGNITSNLPSCAVSSDTLELTVNVKESMSEILKIYANTSGFTNVEQTTGTCEKTVNDEWTCTLPVTGFVSEYQSFTRKVVVEDLAGNKAEKDFKFEVCAEDSNAVPNIITKITQENDIKIDRRTASLLPVKTYVPIKIAKSTGTIIEMTVDNCKAYDPEDNNAEISVLDSGHYFIDNTLVLYIGHDGAKLPESEFDINCTINARVRVGQKIYLKPEQESFLIRVKPYNNPLGVMDSVVEKKISEQKAALRDLDGEIKLRKSIGSVFEKICYVAQIIVKINNILQLIKSIVYAVCVVLAVTGIAVGLAESIWKAVGTALNIVDVTVQTYVWPINILSGSVYGSAIKYTCLLYSCQHYKVSGLIEIGDSIVNLIDSATTEKEKTKIDEKEAKKLEELNSEMEKIFKEKKTNNGVVLSDSDIQDFEKILKNNRDNGQYKFIWLEDAKSDITDSKWISGTPSDRIKYYSGERLFIIDKTKGLMPYDMSPYYTTGNVIADITGNPFLGSDVGWNDINNANQQYYERNLKFYSALESEDWIINPYRSSHWDDLCAPAIVYNLQKERQIRCKYVKCMETQLVAGMPSYICDRDYGMDACLYIDSAQWHVTGGHFFDNIIPGLLKSFFSTVISIALYSKYNAYCSDYLGLMGAVSADSLAGTTLATGWKDVTCGILGTALQWKEITALGTGDFWSSIFKSDTPRDPAEIKDYCAGVNYNE